MIRHICTIHGPAGRVGGARIPLQALREDSHLKVARLDLVAQSAPSAHIVELGAFVVPPA